MKEYDALRKATYLLYNKMNKVIPYDKLINMVSGDICYLSNFKKVYLITLKIKNQYIHSTHSVKRLENLTLPKKYQGVKRTKPIDTCFHAKYTYKTEDGETVSGKISYDHKITKEDVLADFPQYDVTILSPMQWTEEYLNQTI